MVETFLASFKEDLWVLGLSGGPDSMALFCLLKKIKINFVVAHVDHGWREESALEARELQEICREIPFYLKTFKKCDFKGNLEQDGRQKRMEFFQEVATRTGAKGVMLAHHADDLSETVFKRLVEGAHLWNLSPMKKVAYFGHLLILRPFLDLKKVELLAFLDMPYFTDPSNFSKSFLRGRLRSEIFPVLSTAFGKEISGPLREVACEAESLRHYLDETLSPYEMKGGPLGTYLDLTLPPHPFLLQALIYRLLEGQALPARRREVLDLSQAILEKKAGFLKIIDRRKVIADRGFFFILAKVLPSAKDWELTIAEQEAPLTDWRSIWKGEGIGWAPHPTMWLDGGKNPFDSWWTNHKVPAFLRSLVPLLWSQNEAVHEFLTGRNKIGPLTGGVKVKIRCSLHG